MHSEMPLMAFRAPQELLDLVRGEAGRDREGKSGVVRQALVEYFQRRDVRARREAA